MIARWLLPLSLPLAVKAALARCCCLPPRSSTSGTGSPPARSSPRNSPRAVVLALNGAFGAIALLAVLQIALDLGALAAALVQRGSVAIPDGLRFPPRGSRCCSPDRRRPGRPVPPVVDREVVIPGLPPAFEGYRLLQLTDLHLSRLFPAAWARAVVARANAAGADAIVVTGDFIDGSVAMRRDDVAPLAALRAPDGVFGIPGNARIFLRLPRLDAHLAGLGLRMLPNVHAVSHRGEPPSCSPASPTPGAQRRPARPDLAAALKGAPPGAPILLHDHLPERPAGGGAGVALQLSGHTHGGMIRCLDRLVARGKYDGFVSGAYTVGGMTLFVGNGTGIWPGFALAGAGFGDDAVCFAGWWGSASLREFRHIYSAYNYLNLKKLIG